MEIGTQRGRCLFRRRPRVCCWFTNAKIASLEVDGDLCRSSFLAYECKSVYEPSQVIIWLGAVIDMSASRIAAIDKRIISLPDVLDFLLSTSSARIPVR